MKPIAIYNDNNNNDFSFIKAIRAVPITEEEKTSNEGSFFDFIDNSFKQPDFKKNFCANLKIEKDSDCESYYEDILARYDSLKKSYNTDVKDATGKNRRNAGHSTGSYSNTYSSPNSYATSNYGTSNSYSSGSNSYPSSSYESGYGNNYNQGSGYSNSYGNSYNQGGYGSGYGNSYNQGSYGSGYSGNYNQGSGYGGYGGNYNQGYGNNYNSYPPSYQQSPEVVLIRQRDRKDGINDLLPILLLSMLGNRRGHHEMDPFAFRHREHGNNNLNALLMSSQSTGGLMG